MQSDYSTYNFYNNQSLASASPMYSNSSYNQSPFSNYSNYYANYSSQYPAFNYHYNSTPVTNNSASSNSLSYSPDFYLKPSNSYSFASPSNNYNDSAYQSYSNDQSISSTTSKSTKRKSPEPVPESAKPEPVVSQVNFQYEDEQDSEDEDDLIVKRPKVQRLQNASDPNNLICEVCQCEFDSWAKCLMHKHKVHDGLKGTQCPICCK
jgi:hypothetical protein